VHNKDCLARCQANDEALMPAAIDVVLQNARYYAFTFDLDITRFRFERAPDFTIVIGRNAVITR